MNHKKTQSILFLFCISKSMVLFWHGYYTELLQPNYLLHPIKLKLLNKRQVKPSIHSIHGAQYTVHSTHSTENRGHNTQCVLHTLYQVSKHIERIVETQHGHIYKPNKHHVFHVTEIGSGYHFPSCLKKIYKTEHSLSKRSCNKNNVNLVPNPTNAPPQRFNNMFAYSHEQP